MAEAPAEGIGARVTHGAFWTVVTAALNKLVTFGGQVLLAWLLVPEDMGLVAMALSIGTVLSVVSLVGAGNLLVQRQQEFPRLAGRVFWLSLAVNTAAGVFLVLLAPLAARLFAEPRVAPLVLLLAPTFPLQALPTIYAARLQIDLRFRTLTLIYLGAGIVRTLSSVLLAWAGFGPYALVLPLLWTPLFSAAAQRLAAGPIAIGRPRLAGTAPILAPLLWLSLQPFLAGLQTHGNSFVLGLMESAQMTGWFFWGLQLSSQALFLLAQNLGQVIFPGLARLDDDPRRQANAYLRAVRILLTLCVPVCLLQAALAAPVIRLVFHPRWAGAVPAVQALSLGLLAMPLHVAATALLRARGRFGLLCALTALQGVLAVGGTLAGAWIGGMTEIAAGAGVGLLTGYLAAYVITAVACRQPAAPLLEACWPALVAVLIEGALLAGLDALLPPAPVTRLAVFTLAVGLAHLGLLRATVPDALALLRTVLPSRGRP
jgi:O-antigen/teichoic acid export membrane protein